MATFSEMYGIRILGTLLKELGLDKLPLTEQERALDILAHRFEEVVSNTLLRHLSAEQLRELDRAGHDPAALEAAAADLAVEIPSLDREITAALGREYELLKYGMKD